MSRAATVLWRWLRRAFVTLLVLLAILVLFRSWEAKRRPFLKAWHRFVPPSEVRAADLTETFTIEDYLRREDRVFREVDENVSQRLEAPDRTPTNRYFPESLASPRRFPRDWNRTFEMAPEAAVRGGALLLHGLTDSPYSMRRTAEILRSEGIYCLGLRVPGHGTVPGALTKAVWEDWSAATRVGVRHVRGRIGEGRPLYLVGYSNGGALSVKYALDAVEDAKLPRVDRIVLMSPMIGVTPAAGLAKYIGGLAFLPYFEKARWLDVVPEYNPFKYNSFPVNAGLQTSRLTAAIQAQLERLSKHRALEKLPPILAFQSLVDSTIVAGAVKERLFDALPSNGSELVLFDVNHGSVARPFLSPSVGELLTRLTSGGRRRYTLTVISNAAPDSLGVSESSTPAGADAAAVRPLPLAWPAQVYSVGHVAIPFPTDDSLYGGEPDAAQGGKVHLGVVAPRGEKGVLTVSPGDFLRISWNPFFPYVEERVRRFIAP
ncbi:MAG TPA: alpha/beta fold hydrolase [Thermoanaerobaculia bacterium]